MTKRLAGMLIGALLPMTASAHEDREIWEQVYWLASRDNDIRARLDALETDAKRVAVEDSRTFHLLLAFLNTHLCEQHGVHESCEHAKENMATANALEQGSQ
ncbi:MAG: hypothetical protein F4149_17830 [Gammaproteobacteria bacterium]|nr:hypothetical protein [Gammaproteobacteria bacterium]MYK83608.1 hypothetical protein [Gammaproteobacteria bacterium]